METIKKTALFLFVIFVLVLFVWAMYLPKENIQVKALKTLEAQKEKADVSFKNVTFSEALGSTKFWELKAESAVLNKDTGLAELKIVKGVFFKDNKPTFYFISPQAKWEMQKKEIYLEDPVGYDLKRSKYLNRIDPSFANKSITEEASIIEGQKAAPGYWFKADYLDWKLSTQKINCKSGIILSGTDFNVHSQVLEGDLGFNEFLLTGSPYAMVVPSTQKRSQTTIEAIEFRFISAKDSVVASQEVKIVYWDPQIGNSLAHLNTDLAIFSQREGEIYCQNRVAILYTDISAWSDRAALSPKKQVIVLKGNASALQKANRLKGDELTIWLKEKRVSLKGKTKIILTD